MLLVAVRYLTLDSVALPLLPRSDPVLVDVGFAHSIRSLHPFISHGSWFGSVDSVQWHVHKEKVWLSDGPSFKSSKENGQQSRCELEDDRPCQNSEAHLQRAEQLVCCPQLVGQHIADTTGNAEDARSG